MESLPHKNSKLLITGNLCLIRALPFIMLFGVPFLFLDKRIIAELIVFYGAIGTGSITAVITGVSLGLNPFIAAMVVAYIESVYSIFIAVNFDLLLKIPFLGEALRRYYEKAKKVLTRPIIKKVELIGIFALMFIPTFGTGAITMSLVGRALAVKWWKIWLTVSTASVIRSVLIAAAGTGFLKFIL